MFYLLETPAGMALFRKEAEEAVLFAKLKYKSTAEAIGMHNELSSGLLPAAFSDFISSSITPASTLNVLNPEITALLSKKFGLKVVSLPDESFRKLKKNSFKWFDVSKDFFNILTTKIAHKIVDSSHSDILLVDMLTSIEELEKSINNRIMRVREWYSLHFPELNSVSDYSAYLSYVMRIGNRANYIESDKSEFGQKVSEQTVIDRDGSDKTVADKIASEKTAVKDLPEGIKYQMRNSMGCAITDEDMEKIRQNIQNIFKDIEYKRKQGYLLKKKASEAFPNLYSLIGEVLAARMIRKAGSITLLSQCSSSTIQIFGSEKAFNEAIRSQSNTPKYGFIYESDIVSRASESIKGKAAKILANKIALCSRIDSGMEASVDGAFGSELRAKIEKQMAQLEDRKNKAKKPLVQKSKRYISVKEYDSSRDVKEKKNRK